MQSHSLQSDQLVKERDRQSDIHKYRHAFIQTCILTEEHTHTPTQMHVRLPIHDLQTNRQIVKQTDIQTDRQTDRQIDR